MKAQEDGADYVGTGAVYPTNTKVKRLPTLHVPVHAGITCDSTTLTTAAEWQHFCVLT